jgi:prephenate dehydrogenase
VIEKLSRVDLRDTVCLIGGGFIGKMYAIKAKERGAVAIDCGSVFDRWAGRITRGKLKNTDSKEFKL